MNFVEGENIGAILRDKNKPYPYRKLLVFVCDIISPAFSRAFRRRIIILRSNIFFVREYLNNASSRNIYRSRIFTQNKLQKLATTRTFKPLISRPPHAYARGGGFRHVREVSAIPLSSAPVIDVFIFSSGCSKLRTETRAKPPP